METRKVSLTTAEVSNVLREAGAPLWYSGYRAEGAVTRLIGAELGKMLNA